MLRGVGRGLVRGVGFDVFSVVTTSALASVSSGVISATRTAVSSMDAVTVSSVFSTSSSTADKDVNGAMSLDGPSSRAEGSAVFALLGRAEGVVDGGDCDRLTSSFRALGRADCGREDDAEAGRAGAAEAGLERGGEIPDDAVTEVEAEVGRERLETAATSVSAEANGPAFAVAIGEGSTGEMKLLPESTRWSGA